MKSDELINEMLAAVDAEKSRATMETDRACGLAGRSFSHGRWGLEDFCLIGSHGNLKKSY